MNIGIAVLASATCSHIRGYNLRVLKLWSTSRLKMSAEAVLYGNNQLPGRPFPTSKIVKNLTWLHPYLESFYGYHEILNSGESISDMLNIVFVFMGARTATLLVRPDEMALIHRLNTVVNVLGYPEFQLEWQGVGTAAPNCILVYRRDNPRYLRRFNLTQREIGRNLDYFAAGHVSAFPLGTPYGSRPNVVDIAEVVAYETTHGWFIYAERVFVPYVRDREPQLIEFQRRKIDLLNSASSELGLPYRFNFCYSTDRIERETDIVLSQDTPPSMEWWEEYRFRILSLTPRFRFYNVLSLPFYQTNYRDIRMWPLIQVMYQTFASNAPVCYERREYASALVKIFLEFQNALHDGSDLTQVVDEMKTKVKGIENQQDKFPLRHPDITSATYHIARIKMYYQLRSAQFWSQVCSWFRRDCWKVKIPTVPAFVTLDAPPGADDLPYFQMCPPLIALDFFWLVLREVKFWSASRRS
jgi:hypothetical protein